MANIKLRRVNRAQGQELGAIRNKGSRRCKSKRCHVPPSQTLSTSVGARIKIGCSDAYARGQGPPTNEADKVAEAAEKEAREMLQRNLSKFL